MRDEPRDDLSALQCLPKVLLDLVVSNVGTELLLHVHLPSQDFLVGESVKRTGESEESGRVGEVRIREGRSDQVCAEVSKGTL